MHALVGVADGDILAHERDCGLEFGACRLLDEIVPFRMVNRPDVEVKLLENLFVQMLFAQFARHRVDRIGHVLLFYHALAADIAKHGEFVQMFRRNRHFRPADENVRDDADCAQLPDRMLGRFRLEFARRLQVRDEREVHETRVFRPFLEPELPRRLQKRQRLDVARHAADLAQHDIAVVFAGGPDGRLDFVGDVRNDLHRPPEIAARPFARQNGGIDATRGVVGSLRAGHARKALVMPEVQVRLRAVVRHENFAMLVRAHRAGVDVEVGVQLLHEHLVAAAFQQKRQRRARDALAERTYDAARYEYVFDLLFHLNSPLKVPSPVSYPGKPRTDRRCRAVRDTPPGGTGPKTPARFCVGRLRWYCRSD